MATRIIQSDDDDDETTAVAPDVSTSDEFGNSTFASRAKARGANKRVESGEGK